MSRRGAADSFNSLFGSLVSQCASSREARSGRRLPRSHIAVKHPDEHLSLAGGQNKLDFKTIGWVNVDDGTQITAAQTVLGQVAIQNDSVEQVEHGSELVVLSRLIRQMLMGVGAWQRTRSEQRPSQPRPTTRHSSSGSR